jgi:hypothetical protein
MSQLLGSWLFAVAIRFAARRRHAARSLRLSSTICCTLPLAHMVEAEAFERIEGERAPHRDIFRLFRLVP